MTAKRKSIPGGRSVRCVLKLSRVEEEELLSRARARGITLQRYLVECGLGQKQDNSQTLLREVFGVRNMVAEELSLLRNSKFQEALPGLSQRNEKLQEIAEKLQA